MDDIDTPITSSLILKWGGGVAAFVSIVVSLTWAYASLVSSGSQTKQDVVTSRRESEQAKEGYEKRFLALEARLSAQEKVLSDSNSKLETIKVIVERIDRKVGSP